MAATGRQQSILAMSGGVIAGIFAGIVVSLYGIFATLAVGLDPWLMLKTPALPLLGERARVHGFDAAVVLVGLLVHFAISAAWGALFGVIVYRATLAKTLVFGLVYGLLVWIVMYSAVLPAVGLGELARSAPMVPAIVQHLIFGLALAVGFLPFQRRV